MVTSIAKSFVIVSKLFQQFLSFFLCLCHKFRSKFFNFKSLIFYFFNRMHISYIVRVLGS